MSDEFKIDKDEAIELAHKAAETCGMSFEEFCNLQSDNKQTVLNNNIQTCYRYLDFIEEFFDEYNMTMGEGEDDCLLTYGHDYDLPILQLRNALKFIKKRKRI